MNNISNEQEIRDNKYIDSAIDGITEGLIEMVNDHFTSLDLYTNMNQFDALWHITIEHGYGLLSMYIAERQIEKIELVYKHIYLTKHHEELPEDNLFHNGYPKNGEYSKLYKSMYRTDKVADEELSIKLEIVRYYFSDIDSKYPDKLIPLSIDDYFDLEALAKVLREKDVII